jgi:non-ribosomal peptide synthetase component F
MPLVFSKELTDGLKALGRQEGASLYMVLMAALHALLYRLTGETDTIIGAPGGARVRPEYEDIVGLFGHTLPIRADLSGEPSFRRLLKQIRELVLEAHAHQEVPMGKVIVELFPERSLSHSPLFQVALVVGVGDPTGKHLASRRDILNINTGVAKYDLTIQLRNLGNGLIGKAVYRADLYKAATISHLLESFEAALQAININPDEMITNLSLPRAGQLENT